MKISVTVSRFAVLLAPVLTDIKWPREFVSRLQILEKKIYISFTQWTGYKLDIHRGTRSLTTLSEFNFMLLKLDLELGYFGIAGWG